MGIPPVIAKPLHAGEIEVKQLKRENVQFALIAADSLLARDKLNAALKCALSCHMQCRLLGMLRVLAEWGLEQFGVVQCA